MRSILILWILLIIVCSPTGQTMSADTNTTTVEDFDGVKPSWQVHSSDSLQRTVLHKRDDRLVHSGLRSEFIQVVGNRGGDKIFATQDIPPSAAIGEFEARLWVNGNRGGYQLMVRVRLPRTLDERGEPIAMFLYGDQYSTPNTWRQLRVNNIDVKLREKIRVMRVRFGPQLDPGEAYIDMVVLNLFGGAGHNQIWTDDLTLHSSIITRTEVQPRHAIVRLANVDAPDSRPANVRIVGDQLMANDRPWMARAVTYHGEAFSFLKELGFNTVWLPQTATPQQLATAKQERMWLVCPPPVHFTDSSSYSRVAAWCIGTDLTRLDYFETRRRAKEVRERDGSGRPLLAAIREPADWRGVVDIPVEAQRDGNSPTNFSSSTSWVQLGGPLVRSSRWLPLRRQGYDGLMLGGRGFVIQTTENLQSVTSRQQRHLAELMNFELMTLRPWVLQHTQEQFDQLSGQYQVSMVSNQQAGLAFVRRHHASKRLVASLNASIELPDSNQREVFLLEPGGLSPLKTRRAAGGLEASIDARMPELKLLLTNQSSLIQHYSRFLKSNGPRINELMVEVMRAELLELDQRIEHSAIPAEGRSSLREDLHQLHSKLTPLMDAERPATYFQLENALWKLNDLYAQFHQVSEEFQPTN